MSLDESMAERRQMRLDEIVGEPKEMASDPVKTLAGRLDGVVQWRDDRLNGGNTMIGSRPVVCCRAALELVQYSLDQSHWRSCRACFSTGPDHGNCRGDAARRLARRGSWSECDPEA